MIGKTPIWRVYGVWRFGLLQISRPGRCAGPRGCWVSSKSRHSDHCVKSMGYSGTLVDSADIKCRYQTISYGSMSQYVVRILNVPRARLKLRGRGKRARLKLPACRKPYCEDAGSFRRAFRARLKLRGARLNLRGVT